MNEKKVAFIICTNNDMMYSECVRYVQDLEIPQGYDIDILYVTEAESIAAGYNEAMQASDAKYKVYIQEGTFILNRRFIYDMLEICQTDESIGMLGVIGTLDLSIRTLCYNEWKIGNATIYDGKKIKDNLFAQSKDKTFLPVLAVDGTLIVTQYDVAWREDFLNGQDFYDVVHSLEMLSNGLKVVVPYQEEAWCYSVQQGYDKLICDKYRTLATEYSNFFEISENDHINLKQSEDLHDVREMLVSLLENRDYYNLQKLTDKIRLIWLKDLEIREIVNLMEIYRLEEECLTSKHSELFQLRSWQMIYEYYQWIHFVVLRMAYEREDERIEELKILIREGRISGDAIRKIINISQQDTKIDYMELLPKEEKEPLVSVIVPVYNGESFIKETINSILNQTYKNLEIIIIDDCSSDASRDIIDSYDDERIRKIYLKKNRNVCYSGNVGFREATGKYVALIGHDDIWKPEKIKKQVSFLEEHPQCSVCFTWADIIDEDFRIANRENSGLYNLFSTDNHSQSMWNQKLFCGGNVFCAPSACIRMTCLRNVGVYRYALVQLQDYDLWMRLATSGSFYVLQEKLTFYRRFSQEGINLSSISDATRNRHFHEEQWIKSNYLKNLSEKQFVNYLGDYMKNPNAITEKEIACEKAFMLWNIGNCFAEKWFIEILEDEECRDILEEKYSFELKDFYRMNTGTMRFD